MTSAFPQGTEYLRLPRATMTWLVEPLLPQGGLVMLYGEPKVGKSYAALQLSVALTTGAPDWLGFPIRGSADGAPLKVVYLQLDTPRSLWAERIAALQAAGVDMHAIHFGDRETLGFFPFDILNPEHAEHVRQQLSLINPDVVVVDTLREVHSGEENDATTMRNVIAALQAAVQPACLVLVGHSRKTPSGASFDIIADHRGSGYVVGRMDTILYVRRNSFNYVGRAIEGGTLKLIRTADGLWAPKDDAIDSIAATILEDASIPSTREKARLLALKTGQSEEASRSALRRLAAARGQALEGEPAPPPPSTPPSPESAASPPTAVAPPTLPAST